MNWIASDDEDEEYEEEDEEEVQKEDDNEEQENVRSPQGIRCPIAPTLQRFMVQSVYFQPEVTGLQLTHNS